jgi:hypothetical protein
MHPFGKMNIFLILAVTLRVNFTVVSVACAADRNLGVPLLPDDVRLDPDVLLAAAKSALRK